jgi:hypothetical protein
LAMELPSNHTFQGERLLYTASYTDPFAPEARQCGVLLDEWTEVIPSRREDTGLVFHFDRPNSEPPQTLLLAVSPERRGTWTWNDLVDTVHETLELAKLRAVEPTHIDAAVLDQLYETAYARFLPATIAAVTLHPISISANYASVNGFSQYTGDPNA